jgi:Flp pilus assembly protein TadD
LFYARQGRAAEALDMANKDLAVRQDVDAYDTLAWALYWNGRYAEAEKAIGEAMKLGKREPAMFTHAGLIYDAVAKRDKARHYLEQSRDMAPYLLLEDAREKLVALGGLPAAGEGCRLQ